MRGFALAAIAGALLPSPSWAQADVAKALVGRWEGEVKFRDVGVDRNRTVVVQSVREKAGGWAAASRFGVTGKKLRAVDADVQVTGGDVYIGFSARGGATVRLKLVQDKYLVGTYRFLGSRPHYPEIDMTLEKVR
jgi:hypothetical protein